MFNLYFAGRLGLGIMIMFDLSQTLSSKRNQAEQYEASTEVIFSVDQQEISENERVT